MDGKVFNLFDSATGIKAFSILQMLLNNGSIDKNTLLIHINEPKKDLTICVKQVYNNVVYTKSNEFILEKE